MSSIKSALALFEHNIIENEAVGCHSKAFLSNIVKDVSPRKCRFGHLVDDVVLDAIRMSKTAILYNEPSLDDTSHSTDSALDFSLQDISDSSFGGVVDITESSFGDEMIVIAEVEAIVQMASNSTEYDSEDEDEDQVEHQINEVEASSEEEPADRPLTQDWDEQCRFLMSGGRKPVRETGATMSLKDRMSAFNQ
jgi:hypothetical protein